MKIARIVRIATTAWAAVFALSAQTAVDIATARESDLPTLVRALRRTSTASDAVKTAADKLIAEAQAAGATGEARRRLANAWVILNGLPWDEVHEYAWSLALRPNETIADSSLPLIARLTQTYAVKPNPSRRLKATVSLVGATGSRLPLGAIDIPARDLIEQPLTFDSDLSGAADGDYRLELSLQDGEGQAAASVRAPLVAVKGVVLGREAVERRLARVTGHEGAKASVRYPYVLAQTVNAGRRQWNTADFGLPYQPQPPYDFVQGMKTSAELLKALEAGRDPLYRARGDRLRHYWFEEAREMMAYRLYAPLKWDGKSKLPMVLVLHGNTRDQDYYFDRDDRILARLAEQYGYLVVCPMGYRPSAGWGSSLLARRPGGSAGDPARLRQAELSELDAVHVLELVTKEYPVDPSRIYLFGHSAGGAGTWYLGQKYAERWAAIAASAAPTRPDGFPFDRLKNVPVMVCHGDKDDEVPVASSRNMVKAAKENGLDPQFLEVPGATHGTIVALVEPKVFEFFERHRKDGAAPAPK